eukprot:SAG11_NODE_13051_length_672_cov_1.073298_2_plen_124_part_00
MCSSEFLLSYTRAEAARRLQISDDDASNASSWMSAPPPQTVQGISIRGEISEAFSQHSADLGDYPATLMALAYSLIIMILNHFLCIIIIAITLGGPTFIAMKATMFSAQLTVLYPTVSRLITM